MFSNVRRLLFRYASVSTWGMGPSLWIFPKMPTVEVSETTNEAFYGPVATCKTSIQITYISIWVTNYLWLRSFVVSNFYFWRPFHFFASRLWVLPCKRYTPVTEIPSPHRKIPATNYDTKRISLVGRRYGYGLKHPPPNTEVIVTNHARQENRFLHS